MNATYLPLVFEMAFVICMGLITILMFRAGFSKNLLGLTFRLITILGGWGAAILLYRAAQYGSGNFVLCVFVSLGGSGLLLTLLDWRLRRHALRKGWSESMAKWLRLPSWIDRLLTGCLVLVVWIAALIAALIGSEIATLSPAVESGFSKTLLLRFLIDQESESSTHPTIARSSETEAMDSHNLATVRQASKAQAEFLARFSDGVRQSKQKFYDATGLDALKKEMDLTRKVINLSPDDKAWLLTHHPQLKTMIDHPAMVRVLDNRELMNRFERFAGGRVDEVLLIGVDPDIQRLMDDSEAQALIGEIDLEAMLQQCEQRQAD